MQSDGVICMYECKYLRSTHPPLHGLGTTRHRKAEWIVNVYSNGECLLKQNFPKETFWEKWISHEILKEHRNMVWQQKWAREFPLGLSVLRDTDP